MSCCTRRHQKVNHAVSENCHLPGTSWLMLIPFSYQKHNILRLRETWSPLRQTPKSLTVSVITLGPREVWFQKSLKKFWPPQDWSGPHQQGNLCLLVAYFSEKGKNMIAQKLLFFSSTGKWGWNTDTAQSVTHPLTYLTFYFQLFYCWGTCQSLMQTAQTKSTAEMSTAHLQENSTEHSGAWLKCHRISLLRLSG